MFCDIELDQKTFDIIYGYLTKCKEPGDYFHYDNHRQLEEMRLHADINNLDPEAALHWTEDYAKQFRHYLNALKILWAAHMLCYGPETKFTLEELTKMQKNFNKIKPVLEQIY